MWLTEAAHWQELLNEAGIEPGMVVAEVYPSRSGVMMQALAHRVGKQGAVHCIDPRQEIAAWLEGVRRQRGLSNVTLHRGDPERSVSSLAQEKMDRVIILSSLWLVQDVTAYVQEMHRLLKPRGEVVVVEWQPSAVSAFAPPAKMRVAEEDACAAFHQAACYACGRIQTPETHWGWRFVKD
jgi:ubiquinone/menaquinone biosynthesis C-methylase UbiE